MINNIEMSQWIDVLWTLFEYVINMAAAELNKKE